jgi:hypothetical protein
MMSRRQTQNPTFGPPPPQNPTLVGPKVGVLVTKDGAFGGKMECLG